MSTAVGRGTGAGGGTGPARDRGRQACPDRGVRARCARVASRGSESLLAHWGCCQFFLVTCSMPPLLGLAADRQPCLHRSIPCSQALPAFAPQNSLRLACGTSLENSRATSRGQSPKAYLYRKCRHHRRLRLQSQCHLELGQLEEDVMGHDNQLGRVVGVIGAYGATRTATSGRLGSGCVIGRVAEGSSKGTDSGASWPMSRASSYLATPTTSSTLRPIRSATSVSSFPRRNESSLTTTGEESFASIQRVLHWGRCVRCTLSPNAVIVALCNVAWVINVVHDGVADIFVIVTTGVTHLDVTFLETLLESSPRAVETGRQAIHRHQGDYLGTDVGFTAPTKDGPRYALASRTRRHLDKLPGALWVN